MLVAVREASIHFSTMWRSGRRLRTKHANKDLACLLFVANFMTSGAVSGIGPALKVAIIGSGPSAFYSAARLLAKRDVEVHMYERLPTPHGLVRYGVAPDHPEVKVSQARVPVFSLQTMTS